MKLLFEFDIEKKKIVFFGNGFEISSHAETYEEIANFAKCVIENDIGIPNLKHKQNIENNFLDSFQMCVSVLSMAQKEKRYYIKKTMEPYDGQIVLNCGVVTDKNGNELIFI